MEMRNKIVIGFFLMLASAIVILVMCLKETSSRGVEQTKCEFEVTSLEMGALEKDVPRQEVFSFRNTGETALVIQAVYTSCGCTSPEWPKYPIECGGYGEVKVTYDAEYPGRFHKTITVFANISESPVRLSIRGEVKWEE